MSIYEIKIKKMDNEEIQMETYKGKVMLVVITATGCGFTPQYVGLQELYTKYRYQGLEILDFPCNQFANQAPGNEEEIHEFCVGRFGMTFPQFAKVDVNGKDEAPLYTYLKSQKGGLLGSKIKWNFTKFLVDKDGNVVKRYAPIDKPEKIEKDIVKLLQASK